MMQPGPAGSGSSSSVGSISTVSQAVSSSHSVSSNGIQLNAGCSTGNANQRALKLHSYQHPLSPHSTSFKREQNVFLFVSTFPLLFVGDASQPAQWSTDVDVSADSFFEQLNTEYIQLRGIMRRCLSLWRYSHCEFFRLNWYFISYSLLLIVLVCQTSQ